MWSVMMEYTSCDYGVVYHQVLALVFIRKLLDFCFTKRELSYLDDLMPESKKKKLDDASKKAEEVVQTMTSSIRQDNIQTVLLAIWRSELCVCVCVCSKSHRRCWLMTQTEERIKTRCGSPWRAASYCNLLKHQTPGNTSCFSYTLYAYTSTVSRINSHDDVHATVTVISISKFDPLFSSCRTDPSDINISDEMSKTTVWKSLRSDHSDAHRAAGLKKVTKIVLAKRPQPLSVG